MAVQRVTVRLQRNRRGGLCDSEGFVAFCIDGSPGYYDRAWFAMKRFFGDAENVPEVLTVEWDDGNQTGLKLRGIVWFKSALKSLGQACFRGIGIARDRRLCGTPNVKRPTASS